MAQGSSAADGGNEIYVIKPDAVGRFRLTNRPGADLHPVWSPDGRSIAFESYGDHHGDIYVISPEGSGLTRLTVSFANDHDPTWRPVP